ncbi:hypothetical protein ALQ08_200191 [Pseudomonas syringae pv. delphinii]|uniref:Uncharacterized protein n=1 Tax=Pseudomonas syringae pv. delphinii TaxID=192088 RepID=A0A3M4JV77_9PSED|nr:hypothetical protein ALQ08_200191 [Pseudomonas syringae pv. delphinii]
MRQMAAARCSRQPKSMKYEADLINFERQPFLKAPMAQ